MTRQIAPRTVLYRCDRKPLAETIVHSNGAVYTSLIDLTLSLYGKKTMPKFWLSISLLNFPIVVPELIVASTIRRQIGVGN